MAEEFLNSIQFDGNNADLQAPSTHGEGEKPKDAFRIGIDTFGMGFIRGPPTHFMPGFQTKNLEHAQLSLNFGKQQDSITTTILASIRQSLGRALFDAPYFQVLLCTSKLCDIEKVIYNNDPRSGDFKHVTLTITFSRPPHIKADWKHLYPRDEPLPPGVHIRRATEDDWNNAIPKDEHCFQPLSPLPCGDRRKAPMKFGLWRTYQFTAVLDKRARDSVLHTLDRLRTLERGEEARTTVDYDPIRVIQTSPSTINTIADYLRHEYKDHPNSFECQYLFLGLVSHGILLPHADSVSKLRHHLRFSFNAPRVLRALFRLERLDESQTEQQVKAAEVVHITQAGHSTNEAGFPTDLLSDRIFMRRVHVTPTRILLFPATIETSNRVIRHWAEFQDNFLRVSFGDENGKLRINALLQRSDDDNPRTGVLARIRIALEEGIQIGPRHYVFLAAGESQLKEHSCWMIHEEPDRGFTADIVRQHMGNFGHIRIVAKYASRMGLCFSATRKVCDITSKERIPDIEHHGYNYTDGVGNCSVELAEMCAKALGNTTSPSAVQIRMGGYKGVLSVLPRLRGTHVRVRPSMRKFASRNTELGVMKISTHSHAHLNRQAISLLSHLGVPDEVFVRMMQVQIRNIKNIELHIERLDDTKHMARKLYKSSELPILQMLKARFNKEPLLRNVLKCIECQLLQDLKYRAEEAGRLNSNANSTADPSKRGSLFDGYRGRIWEKYTAPYIRLEANGMLLLGNVRSFVIHASILISGDIQLATAIDHERFSSQVWQDHPPTNVVIFSTQVGERNLPSKLSGGDLDGDFFTVLWDPELQIKDPQEPMDYTAVEPEEIPDEQENVEVEDICDFFVEFMKSDVLGLVSSIHEAKSDELEPSDPQCLELARLASNAVDFTKSGVPVKIPLHLQNSEGPDFQREGGYESPKVLGQLYRLIQPPLEHIPISGVHRKHSWLPNMMIPTLYLKEAGKAKHAYDIELEGLMRRHTMCEAELWAGVSVNGDRKKKRERDSAVRGPVKEAMEALRRTYRNHAKRFVKAQREGGDMKKWAIAAYHVTYERDSTNEYVNIHNESNRGSTPGSMYADEGLLEEQDEEVPRKQLISFPWIWALELCHAVTDDIIKEEEEDDAALLQDQVEDV
ncbi:RdRP-domain-containing protein [Guyanagaster necrorhizus]|uniref:RNA-dependent RNA polymerase n=1 Tax=Guyanagaster necrorhizus TaxID=856835 RepID=A0A9P7VLR9_9AGAR|nr:RdRP-domain-containing protein [Guyanagaster necrorhizus MCA 3950]KAG7442680.1 RdRP-domain-containing protein [Guyanagaster necrorhizus MCA 3950]